MSGTAPAGYELDIQSRNNDIRERQADRLLKIREANNALSQQGFQHELSLKNLDLAAQLNDLKVLEAMTDAASAGKDGFYPWDGNLRMAEPHAVQVVNQILAGYGWSRKNPAVMAFRNEMLRAAGIEPRQGWR